MPVILTKMKQNICGRVPLTYYRAFMNASDCDGDNDDDADMVILLISLQCVNFTDFILQFELCCGLFNQYPLLM